MAKFQAIPRWRRERTRSAPRRAPDSSFTRLFARFALTGLVAMLLIGVAGFVLIRHSATASAIRQAKERAALAGRGIVEPLLTPRLLAGKKAALVRLDRTVHRRILRGTPIVRVKIWSADGRVLYSDDAAQIDVAAHDFREGRFIPLMHETDQFRIRRLFVLIRQRHS